MDVMTARVVRGFLMLSDAQQYDFTRTVNRVINGEATRSYTLNESERIIKVNTGPVGQICACCGR